MNDLISRYKNGDESAKEQLLDEIMDMHNYRINRQEATILLYKKHGTFIIF